ncbi:MAG: hypothetical protein EBU90_06030 [Proteobacteria bacterium]|nr:hypothetical protein [Pseudomonadota bacterium]NBP13982.1 hypothetical protein [bacterium]
MNKFVKLYESAISRFTRGGFLTGDLVKFTDNALRDEFFGQQAPNYLAKVKSFIDSGLNMRVSAVKPVRPSTQPGNIQNEASGFLIDITLELAPGLYKDFITLPAHVLQHIDTGTNLAPVPDSLKKTDNVNIKPKEVDIKSEDELMLSPHRQTGTSDQGDKKDSEGDRTLNNFNTAIPSSPAVGEKSPAVEKGTARYLPKQ